MILRAGDKLVDMVSPKTMGGIVKRMPRQVLDMKKSDAFKAIVRYAYKRSKFYKRRFNELKINPNRVNKPEDLKDFFTNTQDIVDHAEEFLCRKPHTVFESSGTTGKNKRIYLTQDELNRIGKLNAMGFFLWGTDHNDRFVNAFDFNIWIPGMITQKGIEQSRIFGMAAGKVDPMEVYKRIPTYKFNVVLGEPTWLIKLTEIAEKHGGYPLKFLIGGAEEMPDAARPWMEKIWQGAKVRMSYASVESAGIIGCELSDACHGYHIDENDFYVEIINQDKDGYGELVFTTLGRHTMPLIRYRNRDVGKIIEEKCPCGIPFRRLAKMRGRTDELVVASGGNLYPLMFEEILKDIPGLSSDWQIIFKLNGIKEILEFNLETKDGINRDELQKKIFSNIQTKYPDLWKNYMIHIFEIGFAYYPWGSIRGDKRKLLRVIDKRYTPSK